MSENNLLIKAYNLGLADYHDIVEHGLWLENQGVFSRYAIGDGEDTVSVWVNHALERLMAPDEAGDDEDEAEPYDWH